MLWQTFSLLWLWLIPYYVSLSVRVQISSKIPKLIDLYQILIAQTKTSEVRNRLIYCVSSSRLLPCSMHGFIDKNLNIFFNILEDNCPRSHPSSITQNDRLCGDYLDVRWDSCIEYNRDCYIWTSIYKENVSRSVRNILLLMRLH